MSDKEPIAIRLAEWFENGNKGCEFKAAAELRRLYEENKRLKKEWVGLTDEDCEEVERWIEFKEEGSGSIPPLKLILYIEAKLKEKNT